MTKKIDNCQLEIDTARGVIYVHSPEGVTLVRICKIPQQLMKNEFFDIPFDRELAKGFNRGTSHA